MSPTDKELQIVIDKSAGKALATPHNLRVSLTQNLPNIANMVGSDAAAKRMIVLAEEAAKKVPLLQNCDLGDVVYKLTEVFQLGLEPFSPLHHAVIIPFKNTKANRYDCNLIIEYQGFIKLADEAGWDIHAAVVYENEPYEYIEGLDRNLTHTPLPVSRRGVERIASYAVAKHKDGRKIWVWMWAEDVEDVRKRSRAKDNGPWVTDTEAMWKKTAIRRLAKLIPMSAQFNTAATLDEREEFGFDTAVDVTPDEKPKTLADQVQARPRPNQEARPDPHKSRAEGQRKPEQQKSAGRNQQQQKPADGSPNKILYDNILAYANGDIEEGDKIAQRVTEWQGKGLTLNEILNANPRRCERGLDNFSQFVEADDEFPADRS